MTTNLTPFEILTYKIAVEVDLEVRWDIFAKRTEDTEDAFKPELIKTFNRQERSVLSKMRGKTPPDTSKAIQVVTYRQAGDGEKGCWGTNGVYDLLIEKVVSEEAEVAAESFVDDIFVVATWIPIFERVARPFVTTAFQEAGQAAFTEIGLEAAFDVTNANARRILQNRVFKFAKEVNETTQARLRTALATGFDAGESIPELSQRVADVFDIAKGSRTDTIARTEIVGASNQGTFQGFVDSDVVATIVWIDSRDSKVRHSHRIDGEEVELGKRFSNGLRFPHDPNGPAEEIVNCRCSHGASTLKEAA